jgi:uncharacterized membrane protein (DUF4010 family)
MIPLTPSITWVPYESLARLMLALLVGLFIGLEREWRGKDAGLRTFGFVSLAGAMAAMLGPPFAVATLGLIGVLVVILNLHSIRAGQGTELTTSAALVVTVLSGELCGFGHTITPVAIIVVSTGLLSWKERLAEFGHKITADELRSAVLLGILAFAVYPVLPNHPVDPWALVNPRAAWITVILIAGIGFANYILWKLFGARGVEFAGFLGGLVNSTVTATELAARARESQGKLENIAYRGVLLSVSAMAVRNAVILGVFKPDALAVAAGTLALMLATSTALALLGRRHDDSASASPPFTLKSPFSLRSALKFGVIFLGLQVVGALAQTWLGRFGFYAVSLVGGFVSSASAVAAAAMLASQGRISAAAAGIGAILASLASATINWVLVARLSRARALTRRVGVATLLVVFLGLAGAIVSAHFAHVE